MASKFQEKDIVKLDDRAGLWQIHKISETRSGRSILLVPVTKEGKSKGVITKGGKQVGIKGAIISTTYAGMKKVI